MLKLAHISPATLPDQSQPGHKTTLALIATPGLFGSRLVRSIATVQVVAPLAPLRHAELATAPPLQSGTYGSGGSRCITITDRGRDR